MKYKSVLGFGKAYFVDSFEAKCAAMDIIMQQYSDGTFDYPKTKVKNTAVIRVEIVKDNLFKKKRKGKML